MGLALLGWSWMRSSKKKPQENEPLVSMALGSLGIKKFKLFLQRCLFRSLSSLSSPFSSEARLLYSLGVISAS